MANTITRTIQRTVATIGSYDKVADKMTKREKSFDTKVTKKAIERTLKDGELVLDVKTTDVTFEMPLSDFVKAAKDITVEYQAKLKAASERAKLKENADKPTTQNFATQGVK